MQSHSRLILVAVPLLVIPMFSQEFRASISGQITDPSGAAVADATIKVTSVERNTVSEAVSNSRGIYLVQFLLPGEYTLDVESPGFKPYLQRGIKLEASDHVNVNVGLEIGAQNERVTVTTEAPLLETETATRATTVENRVL